MCSLFPRPSFIDFTAVGVKCHVATFIDFTAVGVLLSGMWQPLKILLQLVLCYVATFIDFTAVGVVLCGNLYYTPGILRMLKGNIVLSVPLVRSSVRPSFHPDVTFYNQVLLRSFLITYNSAATDQKLFIFGMGVPGRVLFHSTCMNHWVMPQGWARDQNLGHPNKVVFCSLFIQTTSYYTHGIWSMSKGYIVFVHSISQFICPSFHLSGCDSVR